MRGTQLRLGDICQLMPYAKTFVSSWALIRLTRGMKGIVSYDCMSGNIAYGFIGWIENSVWFTRAIAKRLLTAQGN